MSNNEVKKEIETPTWHGLWWDDIKEGAELLGQDLSENSVSEVYAGFTEHLIKEKAEPYFKKVDNDTYQTVVASSLGVMRGVGGLPLMFSDLYIEAHKDGPLEAGETFLAGMVEMVDGVQAQGSAIYNGKISTDAWKFGKFAGEFGLSVYMLGKISKGCANIGKGPPLKLKMPNIFPRPPAFATAGAALAANARIPISVTVPSGIGPALGNLGALGLRGHQIKTDKMMMTKDSTTNGTHNGGISKGEKAKTTSKSNSDKPYKIIPNTKYKLTKDKNGQTFIILNGEKIKTTTLPDKNIKLKLGKTIHYFDSNGFKLMGTSKKAIVVNAKVINRLIINGHSYLPRVTKNGYFEVYSSEGQMYFTRNGTRLMGTIEKPAIIETRLNGKQVLIDGKLYELAKYKDGHFLVQTEMGKKLHYGKNGILIPIKNSKPVILERSENVFDPITILLDGKEYNTTRLDNGGFKHTVNHNGTYKNKVSLFFDQDGYPLFEHTAKNIIRNVDGKEMVFLTKHNGYGYYLGENHFVTVTRLSTGKEVSSISSKKQFVITNQNGTPLIIVHNKKPFVILPDLTKGNLKYARSIENRKAVADSTYWEIFKDDTPIPHKEIAPKFKKALDENGRNFSPKDLAPPKNISIGKTVKQNNTLVESVKIRGEDGSTNTITIEFQTKTGGMFGNRHSNGLYTPNIQDIYTLLKQEPWALLKQTRKIVIKSEKESLGKNSLTNKQSSALASINRENGIITFYGYKKAWTMARTKKVLRHELGHFVEGGLAENYRLLIMAQKLDSKTLKTFMKKQFEDKIYYTTALSEFLAEFIVLYFRDSATKKLCKQNAPHVTKLIEQKLAELARKGVNVGISSVAINELMALFFEEEER